MRGYLLTIYRRKKWFSIQYQWMWVLTAADGRVEAYSGHTFRTEAEVLKHIHKILGVSPAAPNWAQFTAGKTVQSTRPNFQIQLDYT